MAKAIDSNPLGRNCIDCAYHGKIYNLVHCAYLDKVGHMRPCPAGDLCTVKVPYKRRSYPQKGKKVTE